MKDVVHILQIVISAAGGFIGSYLGGVDGFLYALIAFVVTDYVTGVLSAVLEKKLSSEIGFRGLLKKVFIFILVGIANIADVYLFRTGCGVRTMVIFFYLTNEGISILENAGRIGLPIPKKLKRILSQLKDQ